jgi:hypothetical protein
MDESNNNFVLKQKKYYAKVIEKISNGQGCWNSLRIGIFEQFDQAPDIQIGEYTRNYDCMYNTFVPFFKNGQWYALYSKNYTATRIMTLPDCQDWCREESTENGFCPTDYYVSDTMDRNHSFDAPKEDNQLVTDPQFAFVAGCVWGDDSSWKIQLIDLSKLEDKIITRSEKFGYIELPSGLSLKQAINDDRLVDFTEKRFDEFAPLVKIACDKTFDIRTGLTTDDDRWDCEKILSEFITNNKELSIYTGWRLQNKKYLFLNDLCLGHSKEKIKEFLRQIEKFIDKSNLDE